MASQKLSSRSPHPLSDALHLPHPQPLPSSTFFFSPSPYAPFVRKVFEGAAAVAPEPELESADISAESSVSSCFMSDDDDDDEDETGSSSTSSHSSSQHVNGPLHNLTSLYTALPIKRGLSRYFAGKSQSFSSLAQVSSIADLAKPENPYVKRQRTGIGAESLLKQHHSYPPRSAGISKRPITSSRYKKSPSRSEDAMSDVHTNPKPSKCFSVPEF